MKEIPIGSDFYRVGTLDAFKQFHVARRLASVFFALGSVKSKMSALASPDEDSLLGAFEPVAQALGGLSNEDSEYVLKTCLTVVQKKQGDAWANVMASNGALMFQDLDMKTMMQLVVAVIQENMGSFFPEAQQLI